MRDFDEPIPPINERAPYQLADTTGPTPPARPRRLRRALLALIAAVGVGVAVAVVVLDRSAGRPGVDPEATGVRFIGGYAARDRQVCDLAAEAFRPTLIRQDQCQGDRLGSEPRVVVLHSSMCGDHGKVTARVSPPDRLQAPNVTVTVDRDHKGRWRVSSMTPHANGVTLSTQPC